MNKNQIMQNELEKIKTARLNREIIAKQNLLILRNNHEFKEIDDKIRSLKLELSKTTDSKAIQELKENINFLNLKMDTLLNKLKVNKSSLHVHYDCNKCKDTGFIDGKICDCLNLKIERELLKQSGINGKLQFKFSDCNSSLLNENADLNKNYKVAKKFTIDFPNFKFNTMTFIGAVGTGKTFLLECIANELNNTHYVVFSTAFEVNQTMLNSFNVSNQERNEMLSPYFESELLILDDLGSEPIIKNITISNLFTILNERQRANLPTIISTNLSYSELQDRYGDRILSRLFNKRICLPLHFTGKDLRTNS